MTRFPQRAQRKMREKGGIGVRARRELDARTGTGHDVEGVDNAFQARLPGGPVLRSGPHLPSPVYLLRRPGHGPLRHRAVAALRLCPSAVSVQPHPQEPSGQMPHGIGADGAPRLLVTGFPRIGTTIDTRRDARAYGLVVAVHEHGWLTRHLCTHPAFQGCRNNIFLQPWRA
jgi:hypothetical protein